MKYFVLGITVFVVTLVYPLSTIAQTTVPDPVAEQMARIFGRAQAYIDIGKNFNADVWVNTNIVGDTNDDGIVDSYEVPLTHPVGSWTSEVRPGLSSDGKIELDRQNLYLQLLNHQGNAIAFHGVVKNSEEEIKNYHRGIKSVHKQLVLASEQQNETDKGRVLVSGGAIVGAMVPTSIPKSFGTLTVKALVPKTIVESFRKQVSDDIVRAITSIDPGELKQIQKVIGKPGHSNGYAVTISNSSWFGDKVVKIFPEHIMAYDEYISALKRAGAYTAELSAQQQVKNSILASIAIVPGTGDVLLSALGFEMGTFKNPTEPYYLLIKNALASIKTLQAQIATFSGLRDAELQQFTQVLAKIKQIESKPPYTLNTNR